MGCREGPVGLRPSPAFRISWKRGSSRNSARSGQYSPNQCGIANGVSLLLKSNGFVLFPSCAGCHTQEGRRDIFPFCPPVELHYRLGSLRAFPVVRRFRARDAMIQTGLPNILRSTLQLHGLGERPQYVESRHPEPNDQDRSRDDSQCLRGGLHALVCVNRASRLPPGSLWHPCRERIDLNGLLGLCQAFFEAPHRPLEVVTAHTSFAPRNSEVSTQKSEKLTLGPDAIPIMEQLRHRQGSMCLGQRWIEFNSLQSRFLARGRHPQVSQALEADRVVGVRQPRPCQSILWIQSDRLLEALDSGKEVHPSSERIASAPASRT